MSKIVNLFGINQERVAKIRQWHQKQANMHSGSESVATLNISITAAGEIQSAGVAIEPEHALIMLPELERLAAMLRDHVEVHGLAAPGAAPTLPQGANVVSLRGPLH